MPAVWFTRIVDGLAHRSSPKKAGTKLMNAFPREIDVLLDVVAAVADSLVLDGSNDAGTDTNVWIEHAVSVICQRQYQAFDKFNWKLARMWSLLDVVVLDVWNNPQVAWIFAFRIAR